MLKPHKRIRHKRSEAVLLTGWLRSRSIIRALRHLLHDEPAVLYLASTRVLLGNAMHSFFVGGRRYASSQLNSILGHVHDHAAGRDSRRVTQSLFDTRFHICGSQRRGASSCRRCAHARLPRRSSGRILLRSCSRSARAGARSSGSRDCSGNARLGLSRGQGWTGDYSRCPCRSCWSAGTRCPGGLSRSGRGGCARANR